MGWLENQLDYAAREFEKWPEWMKERSRTMEHSNQERKMTEMPELKPCPLCRGKAIYERKGTAKVSMIIACEDCGLRLESGDVYGLTEPKNYHWNTRPEVDTVEALRKRVAELDEWQPIETAPRTGRQQILIWGPNYSCPQVAWSNTFWTAGFSVETKPTHWKPITPPKEKDHE